MIRRWQVLLSRTTAASKRKGEQMTEEDNRLPDHSRLVYGVIWGVVLVIAIPLILLVIFAVLFSDVMH